MKKLLSFALCAIMTFSVFALTASATETYTVVKGDTLWALSRTYETTVDELVALNPAIRNPNLIYPGQKVRVR